MSVVCLALPPAEFRFEMLEPAILPVEADEAPLFPFEELVAWLLLGFWLVAEADPEPLTSC